MSDQNPLLPAIAPASGGALTTSTGPQRIATCMAENLLDVARSQERALAAQRRYRIGDYEFREADYAQIQRWARKLGMNAEEVVNGLAKSQKTPFYASERIDVDFQVQDGLIVSLVWDFDLFPLSDWAWVAGLELEHLGIFECPKRAIAPLAHLFTSLGLLRKWAYQPESAASAGVAKAGVQPQQINPSGLNTGTLATRARLLRKPTHRFKIGACAGTAKAQLQGKPIHRAGLDARASAAGASVQPELTQKVGPDAGIGAEKARLQI